MELPRPASFTSLASFAWRPFFAALAALAAVGASGCVTSGPHLSFAVEQRILRETTLDDMPEDKAVAGDGVVRVIRLGKTSTGSCSGALIDATHVLTAAHCVVDRDVHHEMVLTQVTADRIHIELGGDYLPWGRVGVRHIRPCDGYDGDLAHDIAILVLSKAVPSSVATLPLGYEDLADDGTMLGLGGFGTTEKMKAMPGTSWALFVSQRHDYEGPLVYLSNDALALKVAGVPGDSGGPITDTRTGHLVSVVSRGLDDPDEGNARGDAEDATQLGPLVAGPRLSTCKRAIDETLRIRF